MEGPLRFTTAMANTRPKPEKDPSVTAEEDATASRLPGGGFYDDSDAKLANRYEDRRLAMAIQGISLERCRTVAEIEHGKKTVQKGFHNILSQQQLLDVARADNVIGPRRRPPGETPQPARLPSPRRPLSSKSARASSSPRQHLYLSPSSPNFNPHSLDPHRSGRLSDPGPQRRLSPHLPEQRTRTYDGFHASRPLTSGGRRIGGAQHSGRSMQGAEPLGRGVGPTSKPYKPRDSYNRARTAPGVRRRSQNQSKPVPPGSNQIQSKPVQLHHSQHAPVQTGSAQHSADTDSTDTDDDDVDARVVKRNNPRQRSKSAFGIDQIHLISSSDEELDQDSLKDPAPRPRQRSDSIQGRPHTTASTQSRSRRELSRLTHIDAITAAEMALRRKMWLAKKESQNHSGDTVLQQKVQEFITKLDGDKKKGTQQLMMFQNEEKPTEEHFVLPAV
ncbi:uncharacterized protein LOC119744454 [Patiria miniata]|uniref:Uncharacterized protein n=1 Tax=Patiria miniata TaxID=46514 RepID=A0A914BJ61_PATMI|nr:uncharacterized protein LOC119744454 [Patiria miniata]